MRELNVVQNSPEWFMARLGKFTSSKCELLLKEPKTKSNIFAEGALTYINEKVGEILTGEYDDFQNFSTNWGHDAEMVLKTLIKDQFEGFRNCGFYEMNDDYGGSPDAISDPYVHEIKAPAKTVHFIKFALLKNGYDLAGVNYEYYCQCQSHMLLTERDKCLFTAYDPRIKDEKYRIKSIVVDREEGVINRIVERAQIAAELRDKILLKIVA